MKNICKKYHVDTKTYSNITSHSSFPQYNINTMTKSFDLEIKSRNETQNMILKIRKKSKALFQTNVDYKSLPHSKSKLSSFQHKTNDDEILNDNKCINNFDDQLKN